MMHMKKVKYLVVALALGVLASCDEGRYETKISSHGENESHNEGMDCMICHGSGGDGEGWFSVAGTVYDSLLIETYPNATVKLFTGPAGTGELKYTIEGDSRGNFYTTKKVKFGNGLYPAIEGGTGTRYMSTPITVGNCASCHCNTTSRLWAK